MINARETARRLAEELASMRRDAEKAGLSALVYLIECARLEAEQQAR